MPFKPFTKIISPFLWFCININMKLREMREELTKNGAYKLSNKEIIANWLAQDCEADFQLGLTLMPKKMQYKNGLRHLNKNELEKASYRFVEFLNAAVYKNAYKRFNKKLDVVMTIEGEKSCKDLHSHFVLTKPVEMKWNEFARRVRLALKLSNDFEIFNPNYNFDNDNSDEQYRYKLDIIDSDWLSYITKELDKKDVQNLYFP